MPSDTTAIAFRVLGMLLVISAVPALADETYLKVGNVKYTAPLSCEQSDNGTLFVTSPSGKIIVTVGEVVGLDEFVIVMIVLGDSFVCSKCKEIHDPTIAGAYSCRACSGNDGESTKNISWTCNEKGEDG